MQREPPSTRTMQWAQAEPCLRRHADAFAAVHAPHKTCAEDAHGALRSVLTADIHVAHSQLILLGLALGLGQWLEKKKVDWLGEASVALVLGLAMGILARVFTLSHTYVAWMGFQVSQMNVSHEIQLGDSVDPSPVASFAFKVTLLVC